MTTSHLNKWACISNNINKYKDFHLDNGLLYWLNTLCVFHSTKDIFKVRSASLQNNWSLQMSRIVDNLKRYFYWVEKRLDIEKLIREFKFCGTLKPTNKIWGQVYMHFINVEQAMRIDFYGVPKRSTYYLPICWLHHCSHF
jgi:hypothetical protein